MNEKTYYIGLVKEGEFLGIAIEGLRTHELTMDPMNVGHSRRPLDLKAYEGKAVLIGSSYSLGANVIEQVSEPLAEAMRLSLSPDLL